MEHLYAAEPSFLVVTGRRRVRKTEQIREFCRDKQALYFYDKSRQSAPHFSGEVNAVHR